MTYKFIKLTNADNWSEKFLLRADLIEKIVPTRGGGSEITLTTGRQVVCIEGVEIVLSMIENAGVDQ